MTTRTLQPTRITPGFTNGRCAKLQVSPTAPVLAAAFWNQDEGNSTSEVTLWDIGEMPPRLRHRRSVDGALFGIGHLVFEPDGEGVIFPECLDWRERRWQTSRMSVADGESTVLVPQGMPVCRFVPGTRALLVGSTPPSIFDLDSNTERITFERKTYQETRSMDITPDGRYAAAGHTDFYARIWDPATGKQLRRLNRKGCSYVPSVAFSPDGKLLAFGPTRDGAPSGVAVSLRRVSAKWPEDKLLRASVRGSLYALAYSRCGRFIAGAVYCSHARDRSGVLFVWEVDTGQLLAEVDCDTHYRLAFSSDSRNIFAGVYGAAAIDVYDTAEVIQRPV